jgi:LysM repeat protein
MKGIKKLLQYKIKKGDTLHSIARKNNVDILELLEANEQIENPDIIFADSTINIPERRRRTPIVGMDVDAPAVPKPKIEEEMSSLLDRPESVKYTIQKGDTISGIAKRNKLNTEQLLRSNSFIKDANQIQAGQEINVPQFGLYESQDFKERTNLPAEKPRERFLPSNVRQLLSDINPVNRIRRNLNIGMDDFTEADLTPKELEAARDIARKVITEGSLGYKDSNGNVINRGRKDIISYNDFRTSEGAYDDVGGEAIGIEKAISKFKDPAFSLKTLIGQATITQNDRGETIIIDRYNFNEEDPNSFRDYAKKLARVVSDPIYGSFREAGSIFGSNEGEGSFIRLNLGRL